MPPADADAVLDGLDPEQREVAHGPARSGVRAGRRRHRQDPGDHPPHRLRGARRASPARSRARRHLHHPRRRRDARPAARSSASAACRRAPSTRPRCASSSTSGRASSAVSCPGSSSARSSSSPRRPAGCRIRLDRRELRDVTAEIEWAKVTQTVARRTTPRSPPRAGRDPPATSAGESPRSTPATRSSSATAGLIDFEDVLLLTVARPRGPARHRRAGPRPVPALRRRRVPGRQPAPAAAARAVARRPRQPLRRRRRQPDDLLLHRRHPRPPARLPHPPPRRRPSSSSSATTAPRRRSSHLANGLLAQARGRAAEHRLELVSQRPAGPEPRLHRVRRRARRGRGRRPPDPGARSTQGVPPREIAVLYRINAQSEAYEQALADAGSPLPAARRRAVLRAARGAQAVAAAAGRRPRGGSDSRRDDAVDRVAGAGRARRHGLDPAAPPAAGPSRERWESLAALVRLAEDFAAARPGRHARATSSPSSTSARPPSTPRPSRASPSPPCTPPRAWSGTRSSWSASPRA